MFFKAWLAVQRTGRSGWRSGTKSSDRRIVNSLSAKVSAPRMLGVFGLGWKGHGVRLKLYRKDLGRKGYFCSLLATFR